MSRWQKHTNGEQPMQCYNGVFFAVLTFKRTACPFFLPGSKTFSFEWHGFTAHSLFPRLFGISNDLQKLVVAKEQEKQKILEDTKELTEKNAKISEEMEKKNQELKNVEKWGVCPISASSFMNLLLWFVYLFCPAFCCHNLPSKNWSILHTVVWQWKKIQWSVASKIQKIALVWPKTIIK